MTGEFQSLALVCFQAIKDHLALNRYDSRS
jgi:hypothetical protein